MLQNILSSACSRIAITLAFIIGFGNNGSSTIAQRPPQQALSSAKIGLQRPTGVTVTSKIVFGTARNNGNHDVYVMDADGGNQTQLTTSLAYDDQPRWSPDGSKIVFISGRDGNFEIYSMNANGTGQTRLTNNFVSDGFPAWSPDGTRIAFVSGNLNDPNTF